MPELLILLIVLLVLPVVLIFATAGCVGDDAVLQARQEGHDAGVGEGKKKGAEDTAKKIEEENRYDLTIQNEPMLLSYWRFNESQGAQIAAAIGPAKKDGAYLHTAGITLQHTGALALFKDPQDWSALFEGTVGRIEVPHHPPLNPAELSVEFWIQPLGVEAGPQVVLGSYELGPDGKIASGYVLEVLRETPAGGGASIVKIRARLGGGGEAVADLGQGIQRQGWRHVVMTFLRASTTSLKLYVDATSGDPAADVDNATYVVLTLPLPLRMGGGQSAPGVPGLFYHGGLDEVAIYNGVLTNARVKAHFQKSF